MRLLITGGSGFIGTNVVQHCIDSNIPFINVDISKPLNPGHDAYWKRGDILDYKGLFGIFKSFKPTAVLHLAARTDTDIYDLTADISQYRQNTDGTINVLKCIKATADIDRVIITSSMFVCKHDFKPRHDEDFDPFTLYGLSKVLTEKYTREANLPCVWTIIRPQTIWGPWSMRYRHTMFKVMKKGLYFHPDKRDVYRSYGYIGNVVWQIISMLNAPAKMVNKKTFYVGDLPINLLEWVNCVSLTLIGRNVRKLPTPIVKGIAVSGDILKKMGIPFPITSTRFNSMVQNYITSIDKTIDEFGTPPHTMEMGIQEFVNWSENHKD